MMAKSYDEILDVVKYLAAEFPGRILIGGWSSTARGFTTLSNDIDFILYPSDKAGLERVADTLSYNESVKGRKGSGELDDVHLDAYFTYESYLGGDALLDVSKLSEYVDDQQWNGWSILTPEAALCTKTVAVLGRSRSAKGQKDIDEVMYLIAGGADPETADKIIQLIDPN